MAAACHACGHPIAARERPGRRDRCERCGAELRCCRQCRFYDPRAYNACAEPQAERVLDKERANFCEHFAVATDGASDAAPPAGPGRGAAPSGDARADLERLFRRR
ncbi:MAG TPA: hypothetical protein VGK30_13350 [Candidatus Binatia bacterium]